MPKGFSGAKKVGEFKGGGSGFQPRPKGVVYFALKDGQEAVVRFLQQAEDIEWARKWKLPPSSNFPYGELVNAVDQHEDGTPDPGYAAGLKNSFKAYPTLIWRNAPVYQKDNEGKVVKDPNGAKVITGFADQVAIWECTFSVYDTLQDVEGSYRGLMSRDFRVKRKGGGLDTEYLVFPADVDGGPQPMSQQDQQIAATQRIDVSPFVKIPTYDELYKYIYGHDNQQPQNFTQQAQSAQADPASGPNPFI